MTVKYIQQAITLTECDRCGAHQRDDQWVTWGRVRVVIGGTIERPDDDLCHECIKAYNHWLGKP